MDGFHLFLRRKLPIASLCCVFRGVCLPPCKIEFDYLYGKILESLSSQFFWFSSLCLVLELDTTFDFSSKLCLLTFSTHNTISPYPTPLFKFCLSYVYSFTFPDIHSWNGIIFPYATHSPSLFSVFPLFHYCYNAVLLRCINCHYYNELCSSQTKSRTAPCVITTLFINNMCPLNPLLLPAPLFSPLLFLFSFPS